MRAKLATLRGHKTAVVAWGLPSDHRHLVVTNGSKDRMRREAIRTAVAHAKPGDVGVVAGKGHETGQEVAGVVHPFSDADELAAAIGEVPA